MTAPLLLLGLYLLEAQAATIAWAPATGPVAGYVVTATDGREWTTPVPQVTVPCDLAGLEVVVRAVDAQGVRGEPSEPGPIYAAPDGDVPPPMKCSADRMDLSGDGWIGGADVGAQAARYWNLLGMRVAR